MDKLLEAYDLHKSSGFKDKDIRKLFERAITPSSVIALIERDTSGCVIEFIDKITNTVFEYEDEFFKLVYTPWHTGDELLSFYMGSEVCRLTLLSWSGVTYTDTVKTDAVVEWVKNKE